MRKLSLFLVSFYMILSSSVSFAQSNSTKQGANTTLNVCSESGFIPFEMKDDSGKWVGFDIDLIKKFASENHLNVVMLDISLDGLIPALSTRKCDLIASGLTITEERAKVVLFSQPVYSVVISGAFLNEKDVKNRYKNFNDIDKKGVRIATQTGSAASLFLKKTIVHASIMQYSSENDEVNAVLQNRCDVFVEDNVFISQVEKKLNKQFYVLNSSEKGDLAFAARKEDFQLIAQINMFIAKIKKSGEYEILKQKYFGL